MATRKRNEWLDAEETDEEEQTYESEDEGRAQTLRSKKRQKTDHSDSEEEAPSDNENDDDLSNEDALDDDENEDEDALGGYSSNDAELKRLEKLRSKLPTDLKLTAGQPLHLAPKKDKSGVIYLSRVPPFMKPAVLRSLLTPYGPINRIFLTPETATSRAARLRGGGTRRKLFLDGWVEFLHKKDAKFVAEQLNAQTMGGKKRSRWHDEVWNIKYLSGVKWSYLVEEIQNQNAERAVRLRKEIAKDKLENERFLGNLEKGKMIGGIEKKRRLKETSADGEGDTGEEKKVQKAEGEAKKKERRSRFEQHEMRSKFDKKAEPSEKLNTVLSSIF